MTSGARAASRSDYAAVLSGGGGMGVGRRKAKAKGLKKPTKTGGKSVGGGKPTKGKGGGKGKSSKGKKSKGGAAKGGGNADGMPTAGDEAASRASTTAQSHRTAAAVADGGSDAVMHDNRDVAAALR